MIVVTYRRELSYLRVRTDFDLLRDTNHCVVHHTASRAKSESRAARGINDRANTEVDVIAKRPTCVRQSQGAKTAIDLQATADAPSPQPDQDREHAPAK